MTDYEILSQHLFRLCRWGGTEENIRMTIEMMNEISTFGYIEGIS